MSAARGFTLIEVLATLMLMAIALPAIMHGITLASRAASMSRRHTEASLMATSKLNELVWTGTWQSETSGDFGTDFPDYTWTSTTQDWTPQNVTGNNTLTTFYQTIEQLDVTVKWGTLDNQTITMSTLVYPNTPISSLAVQNAASGVSPTASSAGTTTGTGTTQ